MTVYEGGYEAASRIQSVAGLNDVAHTISVHHSVVGKEINVYGGDTDKADIVSPSELSSCDILELDCEGAEIEILRNLKIRSRVIIIEFHSWLYSDPPEKPLSILDNMGYKIQYHSGHDGTKISYEELRVLLKKSQNEDNDKYGHIDSEARWPVVAAAVYNDTECSI